MCVFMLRGKGGSGRGGLGHEWTVAMASFSMSRTARLCLWQQAGQHVVGVAWAQRIWRRNQGATTGVLTTAAACPPRTLPSPAPNVVLVRYSATVSVSCSAYAAASTDGEL